MSTRFAMWVWLLWLATLTTAALGQGFDGHGPPTAPLGADALAPIVVTTPTATTARQWAVSGIGEVAGSPLVAIEEDLAEVVRRCVLCTVAGLELSAAYGLSDRIGIALVAPVRLAVGDDTVVAAGDVHLWAPVTLVRADSGSATLWPFLSLPTGPSARFLGDGGVGGGALLAAGGRWGLLSASADLGLEVDGGPELGGLLLRTAGALAVHPLEWLALGPELRRSGRLTDPERAGSPLELFGTVRSQPSPAVGLSLGAGGGLTDAPGSAAWRIFAGLSVRGSGPEPELVEATEPEPTAGPTVTVVVSTPDGQALRGARVTLQGDVLGTTDWQGRVDVPRRLRWELKPLVEASAMVPAELDRPADEAEELAVTLDWAPVPLLVRVVDSSGQLLDADISLDGDQTVDAPTRDDVGTFVYALPVGTWTLTTAVTGFSPQERTLVVPPRRTEPIRVDAVLTTSSEGDGQLWLTVTDPDGDPIEGALVELGSAVLGTTGSGGDLRIRELSEGPVELTVREGRFQEMAPMPITITPEDTQPVVMLTHLPGSVEARVTGPNGEPTDALVVLRSPTTSLEPVALGTDGRHVWVLGEGPWTMLVSSPTLGLQQRTLTIDHSHQTMQVVDVRLLPEAGEARLELVAVDASGRPVADALVSIGGRSAGRTSTDGTLVVGGLAPGTTDVRIEADRVRPWTRTLTLRSSSVRELDAILEWNPGTVQVNVLGRDGSPVPGKVRATDGNKVVRDELDLDGMWIDTLPPGEWDLLVSAADLGLQTRSVTVRPDETVLLTVDFRLIEVGGDGVLSLALLAPDGQAVRGAMVSVDGEPLGTSGSGGWIRLEGLARGPHTVRVEADGHGPLELPVELDSTPSEHELLLPWAPGLLELVLRHGDAPLTDAAVRIAGDRVLPPLGPDATGELRVSLTPGTWTVLVSSVSAGLHQRVVTLPARTDSPTREVLTLERRGTASLLVRLRDEDGRPVAGASVQLAEGSQLRSSVGGSVLFTSLEPGPATLRLRPPAPLLPRDLEVVVPSDAEQLSVELLWPRSQVSFAVLDDRGVPLRADLLLQGSAVVPVQQTTRDGLATLSLRPGTWTVFGRTAQLEGSTGFQVAVGEPAGVDLLLRPVQDAHQGASYRFDEEVLFDVGRSELRPGALVAVRALGRHLLDDPSIVLAEVQGHTDRRGTMALNLRLSRARAATVLEALIAEGVPPERLRARGYGMLRPTAMGDDEVSHRANRRVEVLVVDRAAGDDEAVASRGQEDTR